MPSASKSLVWGIADTFTLPQERLQLEGYNQEVSYYGYIILNLFSVRCGVLGRFDR